MEKWYVKNTDDKVFGPIDLETLKTWVKDGRIEPLAGISSDLKNWMLAPMKPELDMNWIVENEPGQFYGPTHRMVLDDLKKAGALAHEARFFQDDRGAGAERIRALESAISAKDAEISQREQVFVEAQKLSGKKDLQLAAAQKESERARTEALLADRETEVQNLHGEIAQLEKQIAELKEEMERQKTPPAREWSTDVIVPEVVANEMPPPVARQAFGFGGAASSPSTAALADLERRAQQELVRIGPLHVKKFFKIKK